MNEIAGSIDVHKEDLVEIIEFMYKRDSEIELLEYERRKHRDEAIRLMENMIYNLFRLDKVDRSMPTIRIPSALHAAVRWDKQQKYQEHDFHDFQHATAALPYCDYFFTEKRLAHLVTQKLLGFDKFYKCVVQTTINEAIISLQDI